ncbi:hypothetical protein BJ994_002513 [Arthrobacter pigmenti]|uniref:DUF559 domain-containing protein n=1 Tax=Arthrobacter pigmenti TaxID=271432 RepID=A0A846RTD6_9MICC|nr:hypothetical protein [Arthrobacter pigmenti]NJC23437.1 hypothetical protein [Arthrobacter pigmenti]
MIHLSRKRTDAVPRRRGVIGHPLDIAEADVVDVNGVPVTSIARTWLDLAAMLPIEDLIVAGDQIVSEYIRSFGVPKIAMFSKADLERFIASHGRCWGIQKARLAIGRLRVGVDSPPETRVRLLLEDAGTPEFTVNHGVRDFTGAVAFWTDLACEAYRTCIEYDGEHHLTPEQQAKDMDRDAKAAELGWAQVKLNRLDLRDGGSRAIAKVRKALIRQGWRPGSQELSYNSGDFRGAESA